MAYFVLAAMAMIAVSSALAIFFAAACVIYYKIIKGDERSISEILKEI